MMITSYKLGQKHYPVPYPWKKLAAYIAVCLSLFGIHQVVGLYASNIWMEHLAGLLLLVLFAFLIFKIERREFERLPFLRKFLPVPAG
jgi:hypothetical protein